MTWVYCRARASYHPCVTGTSPRSSAGLRRALFLPVLAVLALLFLLPPGCQCTEEAPPPPAAERGRLVLSVVIDQLGSFFVLSLPGIALATAWSGGVTEPKALALRILRRIGLLTRPRGHVSP